MNTTHENIKLIENYIIQNNIDVDIDINCVFNIYKELYLKNDTLGDSLRARIKNITFRCEFIARDLLKILYTKNGRSATGLKQGFVYIISNPAWNEYLKIGSTIDVYDRLNTYQTSSPLRDYKLEAYILVQNKLQYEKDIHIKYNATGEWIKYNPEIISQFKKDKQKFLNQIEEFCVMTMMNEYGSSNRVLLNNSSRGMIRELWKISRHVIGRNLETDYLNEISKYIMLNDSWRCIKSSNNEIHFLCEKYNLQGKIKKNFVELDFIKI